MRYAKYILAASLAVLLSGCFSVIRLSKCSIANGGYAWDIEKQAYVWREYGQDCGDPLSQFGLFPTMQMRWQLLRLTWNWAPPEYYWARHLGIPCALLGTLPGVAVDLPVDLISLPWDWKYRGNSCDLVAEDRPEYECRSRCVFCKDVSEGAFARCRKESERNTPNWNKYYGVCPNCVTNALSSGYYF